jgi:hypothetical protein
MWKKIFFNSLNIEAETEKSILIKMPNKSNYSGYKFWHPKKLVRKEGGKGYHLSFSFTDDFKFKIFKNGKGKYNYKNIIDEVELSSDEMFEEFEQVDESISLAEERHKAKEEESYLIIEEPEKKEIKNIEIREELKND